MRDWETKRNHAFVSHETTLDKMDLLCYMKRSKRIHFVLQPPIFHFPYILHNSSSCARWTFTFIFHYFIPRALF
uniref:Uncharacterized protein n=1 Tax=Rhizophora mucronata TaxID=61149 RepID=A0A2P2QWR4_RHIMU